MMYALVPYTDDGVLTEGLLAPPPQPRTKEEHVSLHSDVVHKSAELIAGIRNMDIWRNTPMRWRKAFSKVLYAVTFILLAIAVSLSGSHNGGPFHGGRGASPRTATE